MLSLKSPDQEISSYPSLCLADKVTSSSNLYSPSPETSSIPVPLSNFTL